jgi:Spy/CpxP family protein refolding chaperone
MNPTPSISVLLFGAISVLSTVATTQAQTPPPALNPALNPESRLEAMRARLGLSAEQVAKLKPVVAEESSKLEAIKEDATLSDSQKKEKAGVLMASFREKLGAVLNAEQRAQLAEETQRRGAQGRDEMVQRLQAMKEKLGLSDEQIAKIRPVLMEEGPKLKALKDDKTTSPEEKRATLKQSMERIAAELTPEQKEKMREQLQKRAAQSGEESPKK